MKNMILIPKGVLIRGSNESPDEMPINQVKMDSFWIDKFPVTNRDYRQFVVECRGYDNKLFWSNKGWEYIKNNNISVPCYWNDKNWNQDEHPVAGISWWEAMAYAKFVGKSLPSEAQWEYSARGYDQRRFPWGDDKPTEKYANYAPECEPASLSRASTAIDAYPLNKSFFGCVDMAGNLAEWCLDNASINYEWDLTRENPIYFTDEKEDHIAKGGSGLHDEDYMRCSSRDSYPPSVRDNIVGFRCVINHV
jgi:formylglycine-generating enzyme required for sulfatase activity